MFLSPILFLFFFFNDTATTEIYTLSLHDALPIYRGSISCSRSRSGSGRRRTRCWCPIGSAPRCPRSEEHTSELQSPCNLVCRLLLEKKKKKQKRISSKHSIDLVTLRIMITV